MPLALNCVAPKGAETVPETSEKIYNAPLMEFAAIRPVHEMYSTSGN